MSALVKRVPSRTLGKGHWAVLFNLHYSALLRYVLSLLVVVESSGTDNTVGADTTDHEWSPERWYDHCVSLRLVVT